MTTKDVSANVNLRRGLTLDRLSFTSHGRPLAGTLEHGYFDRIFLGADFFFRGNGPRTPTPEGTNHRFKLR